jgi:protein-disulfide isomerase
VELLLTDRGQSRRRRTLAALEKLSNEANSHGQLEKADHAERSCPWTALAPITLVEYGDYECPHSAMAHSVVNQLKLHFKGQLRFAFRHLPLAEIHPQAAIAAESAEFTGAAGLLW